MSRGKAIGEELKEAYKAVYGNTYAMNSVFAGSNAGLALLGKSIEMAAASLSVAIRELSNVVLTIGTQALEQQQKNKSEWGLGPKPKTVLPKPRRTRPIKGKQ